MDTRGSRPKDGGAEAPAATPAPVDAAFAAAPRADGSDAPRSAAGSLLPPPGASAVDAPVQTASTASAPASGSIAVPPEAASSPLGGSNGGGSNGSGSGGGGGSNGGYLPRRYSAPATAKLPFGRLLIPYESVGAFIGPHGESVKMLRKATRADVLVEDQVGESSFRTVYLRASRLDLPHWLGDTLAAAQRAIISATPASNARPPSATARPVTPGARVRDDPAAGDAFEGDAAEGTSQGTGAGGHSGDADSAPPAALDTLGPTVPLAPAPAWVSGTSATAGLVPTTPPVLPARLVIPLPLLPLVLGPGGRKAAAISAATNARVAPVPRENMPACVHAHEALLEVVGPRPAIMRALKALGDCVSRASGWAPKANVDDSKAEWRQAAEEKAGPIGRRDIAGAGGGQGVKAQAWAPPQVKGRAAGGVREAALGGNTDVPTAVTDAQPSAPSPAADVPGLGAQAAAAPASAGDVSTAAVLESASEAEAYEVALAFDGRAASPAVVAAMAPGHAPADPTAARAATAQPRAPRAGLAAMPPPGTVLSAGAVQALARVTSRQPRPPPYAEIDAHLALLVPHDRVGELLGRGGERAARVRAKTGAKLSIHEAQGGGAGVGGSGSSVPVRLLPGTYVPGGAVGPPFVGGHGLRGAQAGGGAYPPAGPGAVAVDGAPLVAVAPDGTPFAALAPDGAPVVAVAPDGTPLVAVAPDGSSAGVARWAPFHAAQPFFYQPSAHVAPGGGRDTVLIASSLKDLRAEYCAAQDALLRCAVALCLEDERKICEAVFGPAGGAWGSAGSDAVAGAGNGEEAGGDDDGGPDPGAARAQEGTAPSPPHAVPSAAARHPGVHVRHLVRLLVPSPSVGAILGRAGSTVTQLRKETGAAVRVFECDTRIPGAPDEPCQAVHIEGGLEPVVAAARGVLTLLRGWIARQQNPEGSERVRRRQGAGVAARVGAAPPNAGAAPPGSVAAAAAPGPSGPPPPAQPERRRGGGGPAQGTPCAPAGPAAPALPGETPDPRASPAPAADAALAPSPAPDVVPVPSPAAVAAAGRSLAPLLGTDTPPVQLARQPSGGRAVHGSARPPHHSRSRSGRHSRGESLGKALEGLDLAGEGPGESSPPSEGLPRAPPADAGSPRAPPAATQPSAPRVGRPGHSRTPSASSTRASHSRAGSMSLSSGPARRGHSRASSLSGVAGGTEAAEIASALAAAEARASAARAAAAAAARLGGRTLSGGLVESTLDAGRTGESDGLTAPPQGDAGAGSPSDPACPGTPQHPAAPPTPTPPPQIAEPAAPHASGQAAAPPDGHDRARAPPAPAGAPSSARPAPGRTPAAADRQPAATKPSARALTRSKRTDTYALSSGQVGALLGRAGANIAATREMSGAWLHVRDDPSTPGQDARLLEISGPREVRAAARSAVDVFMAIARYPPLSSPLNTQGTAAAGGGKGGGGRRQQPHEGPQQPLRSQEGQERQERRPQEGQERQERRPQEKQERRSHERQRQQEQRSHERPDLQQQQQQRQQRQPQEQQQV